MRPVLLRFQLGGTEVVLGSYSTLCVLAGMAALACGTLVAARRGLPWRRALAVYGLALAAGIVGARVFDLVIAGAFYAGDFSRIWSATFQGFSLYGGFLTASLGGIAFARAMHMPTWRLADSAVPALALGLVLMRTGCFLRGCCFGVPTDLPWGVTFPPGSHAWTHQFVTGRTGILAAFGHVDPVHPTQLYEMAAAVILAAVAIWVMQRRRLAEGTASLTFAFGFTLFSFGNGFLRARQSGFTAPEWFYPMFYLALALLILSLALRLNLPGRNR